MTDGVFRIPRPKRPARRRLRRAVARVCALAVSSAPEASWLRVLTYHRVNDSHPGDRLTVTSRAFAEQMRVLTETHRVVALGEALERLGKQGRASEPVIAVTFDDGYRDNHAVALPILERHGIRATFFLVSGNLGSPKSIARYTSCCDDDASLSLDEARDLLERGHEVGAHGRTHRELGALDSEEAEAEIVGCREDLTRALGRAPGLFCYPRGSESSRVRRMVAAAGFEGAVTVYPGPNGEGSDPFALARTEISGDDDITDFRLKLSGGFDGWHQFVQKVRRTA